MTNKRRRKPSREEFIAAVKSSQNWKELSRKVKGSDSGSNVQTVKRYTNFYNANTDHFTGEGDYTVIPKYTPAEMFTENCLLSCTVVSRAYRKLYPQEKCEECGIGTTWNSKPLTLHIDHRNGRGTDNRLSNMRYICPNCHYQTETHGTKRGYSGIIKATPKELSDALDELGNYIAVGDKFKISDRSVKNIVRKYRNDLVKASSSI